MAGYYNHSMSNNAIAAYAYGEKPLSRWRKRDILETAAEYLAEQGDTAAAPFAAQAGITPANITTRRISTA